MSGIRIGNSEIALRKAREADLARRQSATTILSPTAVQGKISAAKVLMTTLNGIPQAITAEHLAVFRARIKEVGSSARAGITIAEAIAMSRPVDLKRAREEIRYAVPVLIRGNSLRLATDAGPNSKVTRHFVTVEFPSFSAAVARPATPLQAAAWLVAETSVKWDCSCEAHTFWFRYVASIGGWATGRQESGFPKIRNPRLAGCCCKHAVRALDSLSGMLMRRRLAEAIEAGRKHLDSPASKKAVTVRATQAQADALTAARVRRIRMRPEQRGASLPKIASGADIARAMAALQGRTDINNAAILRALQSLINQPQKGAK